MTFKIQILGSASNPKCKFGTIIIWLSFYSCIDYLFIDCLSTHCFSYIVVILFWKLYFISVGITKNLGVPIFDIMCTMKIHIWMDSNKKKTVSNETTYVWSKLKIFIKIFYRFGKGEIFYFESCISWPKKYLNIWGYQYLNVHNHGLRTHDG